MASIRVHALENGAQARWDAFVDACDDATFFHRAGWKRVIEESLGHEAHFLYAEDDAGRILGVLPLVFIRSPLFGRSLSSTAFCVYGGPAVTSPEAADALTARAVEIGQRLRVGHTGPFHSEKVSHVVVSPASTISPHRWRMSLKISSTSPSRSNISRM